MVKKTKTKLNKLRLYVKKKPILLLPLAFLLTLLVAIGVETSRAMWHENELQTYKKSAAIKAILTDIALLSSEVDAGNTDSLCQISFDTIGRSSETLKSQPTALLAQLHERAQKEMAVVTTFGSPLEVLPFVKSAREQSDAVSESLEDIYDLTSADVQMAYCEKLSSLLHQIDFLQGLKLPQGVEALVAGQVEDFQSRTHTVQDEFLILDPPSNLREEHVQMNEIFNQLSVDLRLPTRDAKKFSSRIAATEQQIQLLLEAVAQDTTALRQLPIDLTIAANKLQ